MHWIQLLWVGVALMSLVAVVRLMLKVVPGREKPSTPATKIAWLVAATTSGTMLVLIAAKVSDLLPNATIVDVGALAITGVLTGMFLAFGLTAADTNATDS
jgi:hypothetical protein